jgi:hypothetical protein
MATVAKRYDLDYAGRAVGEACRGAGHYRAAMKQGSRRAPGESQAVDG